MAMLTALSCDGPVSESGPEFEKFADRQGNLIGRVGRTESDSERKSRCRRQKGSTTIHLITLHFCRAERPRRLSVPMSTVADTAAR
jgi:hypothetical protein